MTAVLSIAYMLIILAILTYGPMFAGKSWEKSKFVSVLSEVVAIFATIVTWFFLGTVLTFLSSTLSWCNDAITLLIILALHAIAFWLGKNKNMGPDFAGFQHS